MGEEPRPYPEPVELAEALWLHAYQTLAARLPPSDRPPQSRPSTPPGLSGLPEPSGRQAAGPGPEDPPGEPADGGPRAAEGSRPEPRTAPAADRAAAGGREGPGGGRPWPSPAVDAPRTPLRYLRTGTDTSGSGAGAERRAVYGEAGAAVAPGPDLRDAPEIGRRLRPLKQVVPSASEVELDEEATAEHAAEDGLWLPYTRSADERRFDLVLVVDDHPTMVIWQQTITEFTAVAEQLGAFRDVRVRRLGLREGPGGEEAVLRGPHPDDERAGAPGELVDRTGRRIVLVLTDGLGPLWRGDAGRAALELWGAAGPVAVVHLLSQRDWHRTAVVPRQARLHSPRAGARNTELSVHFPPEQRDPFDPPPDKWTVAVPVLELDADWLGRWARLVAGDESGRVDAPVLLLGVPERPVPDDDREPPLDVPVPSVRERIRRFRSHATPTAFRLATHLAAAVLEPRLVRDVQRKLVPEAQPVHLAELFLSGLLEQTPPGEPPGDPARIPLDFVDGAREELLSAAMRADTARVVSSVSDFYGDRFEAARGLHGALLAPEEAPDPPVTAESLPFVRVELAVLRALSGPYLLRARRISAALEGALPGASITQNTERMVHDVHNVDINSDTDGLIMTDTTASQHQREDGGAVNSNPAKGIPAPSPDGSRTPSPRHAAHRYRPHRSRRRPRTPRHAPPCPPCGATSRRTTPISSVARTCWSRSGSNW